MRKGEQELPDSSVCLPVWAFFSVFSVASVAASQCRSVALLLHCSAVLQVSLWIVCAGDTWQLKLKCRRHRCTYLLGSAHGLGFPFPNPLPVSRFPLPVWCSPCRYSLKVYPTLATPRAALSAATALGTEKCHLLQPGAIVRLQSQSERMHFGRRRDKRDVINLDKR